MKKRILSIALAGAMCLGLAACGGSGSTGKGSSSKKELTYAGTVLGENTDLKADITVFNHRTDLDSDDYNGTTWKEYLAAFNKEYPNINVKITTDTNYPDDALTHLQSGSYETVMMIPAINKSDVSSYFMPLGTVDEMDKEINYANTWAYDGEAYGIPATANAQGIVYNKKVFKDAGITDLPKTPDEFIADLQKIKDNTKAIPLYTNYAAGWTMGAWDAYIGGNATGDPKYMNQKLVHTKNPFSDPGDGTHAYNVYKVLYDAVSKGLTEDDYTTTDWEGSKGMLNSGKIGCMVLGSWAYPQMVGAGDHGDDIGYMAFPLTVNGKQYAAAGPDTYSWGISNKATDTEKQAALIFVKWMTDKSGFAYNEYSLPISKSDDRTKLDFDGVELVADEPALEGEEDYLDEMNSESELNINNGGNDKVQAIVEHASKGDESFDDIMKEWNQKWSEAQEANGIDVKY